ncbi:MAG TPA: citrate transporter [Candidatus Copromonas faecavium]|uniref:Citrate transporter n=1 Tax=Candidatus Copromonas faecavium (nom. illeg.) TaxID=2840740 RepID=A0A9D1D5D1_9FIRM|nr:citrate transporter [Candidatus Copromonas faecavium]
MAPTKQKKDFYLVHMAIGIGIMLLFRFLPLNLPNVTDTGMEILGIFIGTLYLWSTSDPIWSSVLAIFLTGLSGYADMNTVLTSTFGTPILVQVFFLLTLINCLIENNLTEYCGRFFLTRKICTGRPWLLTFFIMLGCMLMGAFMGGFTPVFLFWPILYDIFETVGMKPYEKYPTIMVILVIVATLLGFPIPPFMGNGLALISNYRTVTGNMGQEVIINDAGYLIVGLVHATVCIVLIILFCKFILRPDTSRLKSITPELLDRNPLPPMTFRQKFIGISFAVFICILLIPSVASSTALGAYVKANTYGISLGYTFLLCAIRIDKKPLLNFPQTMRRFSWGTYFLIASAILLGNALTSDVTGISPFLNTVLMPIFEKVPTSLFAIIIMLFTVALTNVCNSFVIGILLQPVIATFCLATGTNSTPIVAMMILFVLSSAAITPAASPFAALMFGNKEWLKSGEVYKYSSMFVVIELVVVLLCSLPLANLLLH